MVHALKTVQPYFDDIWKNKKSFEVRKNDRLYKVGDIVALNEWNEETKSFTGRYILSIISYILDDERYVKENYVVFEIKPLTVSNSKFFDWNG